MKYYESFLKLFGVREEEVGFNPMCMQKYELITAQKCLHIYMQRVKFCVLLVISQMDDFFNALINPQMYTEFAM